MRGLEIPHQSQPTAVRHLLQRAELVRYWWEYRGRLRELLRVVDPARRARLTRAETQRVREYWRRYGVAHINLDWYRLFKALTGSVDPNWIPEETFRTRLEPYLCRRDVSAAYHDKNQMDRLFADLPRPRTVLRNIYGSYCDGDYRPLARDAVLAHTAAHAGWLFLKPAISGTGSGHNVIRVQCEPNGLRIGASVLGLAEIERVYVQDFLVQEAVLQHAWFAKFHGDSLNTLRVVTLRRHGRPSPIAMTFRMGNGKHVDNGHAGGLLSGVDLANGRLTPFACDVLFRKFDRHPLSGEAFANQTVPAFGAAADLALAIHERLAYFDMVSCDIAVTQNGAPCIVEVNTFGQGIEPHQFLKGSPLFGEHTDEVLSLVAERARSGWNQ